MRRFLPCVCAITLLVGCKDQRRHEVGKSIDLASQPVDLPANASALDVARAAFLAIADAQSARGAGLGHAEEQQSYTEAMARLASLSASKEIHQQIRQTGGGLIPKSINEKGALTLAMESWTSALAHYVNGYRWDSLRYKGAPTENSAIVHLEANNPAEAQKLAELAAQSNSLSQQQLRERALKMGFNTSLTVGIDVRLMKLDGQWRVLRVELVPAASPAAMTQPVTTAPSH